MKHPDELVEKVLAEFRKAEPPPGLELRILDRLVAHPSASTVRRHPMWWMMSRPIAKISFAGTMVLVGLLVMVAVMHRPMRKPIRTVANLPAEVDRPSEAEPAKTVPTKTASVRLPAITSARLRVAFAVRPAQVIAGDAGAPAEAASFPAPPMPLSEQERLLLRMAHSRDVQSVAILRPEIRAKQEAVEIAQFEDFFKEQKIEVRNAPAEQR